MFSEDDDDFDFLTGGRYWDDDGTQLFPDRIPKPDLCLGCSRDTMKSQIVLCNLTRLDQRDKSEFKCFAYRPKSQSLDGDYPGLL